MTHEEREQESKGVKVVDRRRFVLDEHGDVIERPDAPKEMPSRSGAATVSPPASTQAEATTPASQRPAGAEGRAATEPPGTATASGSNGTATRPGGAGTATTATEEAYASQLFMEFLNSLAHSVLVHLGEVSDPATGLVQPNLDAARQTLEILSVLRHKTEGNLSAQEVRFFDTLLYELMLRYRQKLEASGTAGGAPPSGTVPPRGGVR